MTTRKPSVCSSTSFGVEKCFVFFKNWQRTRPANARICMSLQVVACRFSKQDFKLKIGIKAITMFIFAIVFFLGCIKEGNKKRREEKRVPALSYSESRAAWRQHQRRLCSRRSAGNYDNNVFPRRLLSDFVSEHLPLLKSPPDNI